MTSPDSQSQPEKEEVAGWKLHPYLMSSQFKLKADPGVLEARVWGPGRTVNVAKRKGALERGPGGTGGGRDG